MTNKLRSPKLLVVILLSLIFSNKLVAQVDIVITSGIDNARPVAILPFEWRGIELEAPQDVSAIISADLRRSGRFNPMARNSLLQKVNSSKDINLKLWREKGIEAVAVGFIEQQPDGRLKVGYELVDIFRKRQELLGGELVDIERNQIDSSLSTVRAKDLRFHAHRIADRIYEKLTGERGAFATRIAYVSVDRSQTKPYRLMVADSDGFGAQTVFASTQPIMSPAWSPDAQQLAYVSFENGPAHIYISDIYKANSRRRVAAFEGINSAPAFSPDGRRLAMTLSRDGNAEVYVLDLISQRFSRITRSVNSIETEPSWSPDGQSLLYTSDRGKGLQIYQQNLASNKATRLTWEGNYNASASLTPDGKSMVLINRTKGIFHVAVQDMETSSVRTLTKTTLDESPSIAPNGSMVIYATVYRGRKVLSVVSTDGRFKARLPSKKGEVKAPVWSPYLD
jgi:TolB protein